MASASNGEKARTEAAKSPKPTSRMHFFVLETDFNERFVSLSCDKQERQENGEVGLEVRVGLLELKRFFEVVTVIAEIAAMFWAVYCSLLCSQLCLSS